MALMFDLRRLRRESCEHAFVRVLQSNIVTSSLLAPRSFLFLRLSIQLLHHTNGPWAHLLDVLEPSSNIDVCSFLDGIDGHTIPSQDTPYHEVCHRQEVSHNV